jgi:hypothetical protein
MVVQDVRRMPWQDIFVPAASVDHAAAASPGSGRALQPQSPPIPLKGVFNYLARGWADPSSAPVQGQHLLKRSLSAARAERHLLT